MAGRRLFRPEAVAHHRLGEDEVRLPHYATMPIRVALWTLIVLVLAVVVWAFTASVPRYTTGSAVVVDTVNGPLILATFPPGDRVQLREGAPLTVTFDQSPEPVVTRVSGVLPAASQTGAGDCLPGTFPAPETPSGAYPARAVATFPTSTLPVRGTGQAMLETGRESLLSWIAP